MDTTQLRRGAHGGVLLPSGAEQLQGLLTVASTAPPPQAGDLVCWHYVCFVVPDCPCRGTARGPPPPVPRADGGAYRKARRAHDANCFNAVRRAAAAKEAAAAAVAAVAWRQRRQMEELDAQGHRATGRTGALAMLAALCGGASGNTVILGSTL
jgi:hypothetical protein